MGKDKLVLHDSTEITLESSQGIGMLCVCVENRTTAGILWEQITKDNLSEVLIVNSEGETTGRYTDMSLDYVTGTDNADGTVLFTISLREKTIEEILQERVSALEAEVEELKSGRDITDSPA